MHYVCTNRIKIPNLTVSVVQRKVLSTYTAKSRENPKINDTEAIKTIFRGIVRNKIQGFYILKARYQTYELQVGARRQWKKMPTARVQFQGKGAKSLFAQLSARALISAPCPPYRWCTASKSLNQEYTFVLHKLKGQLWPRNIRQQSKMLHKITRLQLSTMST